MRRRCLFSLFAALSVAACAHPVTPIPAGQLSWTLTPDPDETKLAFGEPGTDNVLVMLACQPRSGQVLVTLVDHQTRTSPVMTLQSGRTSSKRPAQAQPDAMTGAYLVEATARADDPALRRFERGEPLSVRVGAQRTHLPADRENGRRFVETCRGA